uniref:Peroxin-5 n=1 Tax=Chromera velia CCMP2878 TaxID=1169474 RepID=A0A0G4I979_9ALVE|eukprot:Cvel_12063.t1-p1 / transcript=Cvel_12063.t1 / gene=Cvel_12063 / organism=Chromera_velia_CCMP2878 / gene_product=hypothetical protein / transcript_product=hypothetical protein / location=Cvel_scaffold775:38402-43312(+) / protein_length=711 / sequence_SO=supercontig / SO=protein_coding / is_pseudo=false
MWVWGVFVLLACTVFPSAVSFVLGGLGSGTGSRRWAPALADRRFRNSRRLDGSKVALFSSKRKQEDWKEDEEGEEGHLQHAAKLMASLSFAALCTLFPMPSESLAAPPSAEETSLASQRQIAFIEKQLDSLVMTDAPILSPDQSARPYERGIALSFEGDSHRLMDRSLLLPPNFADRDAQIKYSVADPHSLEQAVQAIFDPLGVNVDIAPPTSRRPHGAPTRPTSASTADATREESEGEGESLKRSDSGVQGEEQGGGLQPGGRAPLLRSPIMTISEIERAQAEDTEKRKQLSEGGLASSAGASSVQQLPTPADMDKVSPVIGGQSRLAKQALSRKIDSTQRQFLLFKSGLDASARFEFEDSDRIFTELIERYETPMSLKNEKMRNTLARAYSNRGNARMMMEQPTTAILDFTNAINLNPDQPEFWVNRALCYEALGHKAEEEAAAEILQASSSSSAAAKNEVEKQGRVESSEEMGGSAGTEVQEGGMTLLSKAGDGEEPVSPSASSDATSVEGVAEERVADGAEKETDTFSLPSKRSFAVQWYREALDNFDHALVLQPNDHRLCVNMGELYARTGDFATARDFYRRALLASPSDPALLGKVALTEIQTGNLPVGATLVNAVTNKWPSFWEMQLAKGVLAWNNGEFLEGMTLYKVAVRQEPRLSNLNFVKKELRWPPYMLESLQNFLNAGARSDRTPNILYLQPPGKGGAI